MRARLVGAIAALVAVAPSVAGGEGAAGRQPLVNAQLAGYFHLAAWQGNVTIRISEGPRIRQVDGILPGTCRDKRTGRLLRAGPDGAIGLQFIAYPDAPIRKDGSFSFTVKGAVGDIAPHTITMRGTFYGNNVLGSVKGHSGTMKYDHYSSCSGDQPFWAKRIN